MKRVSKYIKQINISTVLVLLLFWRLHFSQEQLLNCLYAKHRSNMLVFCRPRGQLGTCSVVSQIGSTRSCWDNSCKHPTHKKGVCVSKSKYFTNQFNYFPWQRDQFLNLINQFFNFTNISAIRCVADVKGNCLFTFYHCSCRSEFVGRALLTSQSLH